MLPTVTRTRVARWVFYIGFLSLGGAFVSGITTRPATALVSLLLMMPYLVIQLQAGYNAAESPNRS